MDMEFVQFFPIGHLAPRLVGMDPIMWDPFRYKLGGRLLNARMEEFLAEEGKYTSVRDRATHAILKEVAAGRGTPHGGVWLSFRHCSEAELRGAFGPVIDRLGANGIDLTRDPIEVAPIAHYHMGGIRVDSDMRTGIAGLFAAGEAVGGANGANRLSGNAISEAFTFGRRAGLRAAELAAKAKDRSLSELRYGAKASAEVNPAAEIARLQQLMNEHVGPLRTASGLDQALHSIMELEETCAVLPAPQQGLDARWMDLHDLRNMRLVAECITRAALGRSESRGAHQREDFPEASDAWQRHQRIRLSDGGLRIES
jgi:succinate dehydrogenase/fumarate reductase flavoprotein subunit